MEESCEEFELFFSVGEGFGDVAWGESLLVEEDAASEQGWCTLLRAESRVPYISRAPRLCVIPYGECFF